MLTGFQEVEDNLAALRILEAEAQGAAGGGDRPRASRWRSLSTSTAAGIVSYLNVIVAQSTALANERTAVAILGRRLTASVLLIKALGGGWDAVNSGKREPEIAAPGNGGRMAVGLGPLPNQLVKAVSLR